MAHYTKIMSDVMLPSSASIWRRPYEGLEMPSAWLQRCLQSHDTCSRTKDKDHQRPSRLISVKDDTIKLVLTADWKAMPPYATLSYCWGTEKFMMLKCENLADFLVRIPHEDLPKTFQDAVLVTRKLGIGYIWIDALCIVQDSPDNVDWSHESSRMCSVYSGSHINIAASSAKSVFDGMFTRSKFYSGGLSARVTAINDGEVTGFSCVRNFLYPNIPGESSDDGHLVTRAWALQERLLPPRTLSIGDKGLFWECRDAVWSEYLPDGMTSFYTRPQVRAEDKKWVWSEIVSRYSKANLTYGTDKLPALSGIAARQRRITKDTYLAGMWKHDLHLQLHWRIQVPTRKLRWEWRAPSWSWMSIDGTIIYPAETHALTQATVFVNILDAWTLPTEPDGCGTISDGQISLLCSGLVDGHIIHGNGVTLDTVMIEAIQQEVQVFLDCAQVQTNETGLLRVFLLPTIRGRIGGTFGVEIEKLEKMDIPQNLRCPCLEDHDIWHDEDDVRYFENFHVCGLVLGKISNEPGQFCRVGSFELRHTTCPNTEAFRTKANQQYHQFLSAFEQIGRRTAESVCNNVTPRDERPEMQYELSLR